MKLKAIATLARISLRGGSQSSGMFAEFQGIPYDAATEEPIDVNGTERLFLTVRVHPGKEEDSLRVIPLSGDDEDTLLVTMKAPEPFFTRLMNVGEEETLEVELTIGNIGAEWPASVSEGICTDYSISVVPHDDTEDDLEDYDDEDEDV
jgi:hypothetical protein